MSRLGNTLETPPSRLRSTHPEPVAPSGIPYELLAPPPSEGLPTRLAHLLNAWRERERDATPADAVKIFAALSVACSRDMPRETSRALEGEVSSFGRTLLAKISPAVRELSLPELGEVALACKILQQGDSALVFDIAKHAATRNCGDHESLVGLSRVAHLLSVRGKYVPEFFDAISKAELPYDTASYANFAGAIAKLDPKRQLPLTRLVKKVLESGETLDNASERRIEKAIESIRGSHPEVARIIAGDVAADQAQREKSVPSDVLAWFKRMGYPMYQSANRRAEWASESFYKMNLSELAGAAREFTKWGVDSTAALKRLGHACESKLEAEPAKPQELISLIVALAHSDQPYQQLLHKIADKLEGQLHTKGLKECAAVACALGDADIRHKNLLFEIGTKLAEGIEHFDRALIPPLLRSFVQLNIEHQEFFSKAIARISGELSGLPARETAQLVWAIAKLNGPGSQFLGKILSHALTLSDKMSARDATWCAWAAASQGYDEGAEFIRVALQRLIDKPQTADKRTISMLYQATLAFELPIDPHLEILAQPVFEAEKLRVAPPNGFEQSVADTLKSMGIPFQAQYFVAGYFIDHLIEIDGRRIAIESDGSEYHRVGGNDRGRLIGNNVVRDKALRTLGINTVRIIDHDWDIRTAEQKIMLIAELLELPENASASVLSAA